MYVNGANYSGSPEMTRRPLLRKYVTELLAEEVRALPMAVWVPLGPKPATALALLAQTGAVARDRVLGGLPHPSGANAERIPYFLGRKSRAELSAKTNPVALDRARAALSEQVTRLGALPV